MPMFAGLFAGLFASLASFFAQWLTKKVAFGAAAVATFGILTAAFMAVIASAISAALAVDAMPSWVVFGFVYFMPSNFPAAVSSIVAAHVAAGLYRWNVENVRLMAYVT